MLFQDVFCLFLEFEEDSVELAMNKSGWVFEQSVAVREFFNFVHVLSAANMTWRYLWQEDIQIGISLKQCDVWELGCQDSCRSVREWQLSGELQRIPFR